MTEHVICSARGCRGEAEWALQWRNPRIHGGERLKVWTACEDHLARLQRFLADRQLPVAVVPIAEREEPR